MPKLGLQTPKNKAEIKNIEDPEDLYPDNLTNNADKKIEDISLHDIEECAPKDENDQFNFNSEDDEIEMALSGNQVRSYSQYTIQTRSHVQRGDPKTSRDVANKRSSFDYDNISVLS